MESITKLESMDSSIELARLATKSSWLGEIFEIKKNFKTISISHQDLVPGARPDLHSRHPFIHHYASDLRLISVVVFFYSCADLLKKYKKKNL